METRRLLVFPRPEAARRELPRGGLRDRPRLPPFERQQQRLDDLLARLRDDFRAKRAELRVHADNLVPEEVLVLEVAGTIDGFVEAAEKVLGLEPLGGWAAEAIDPDDDFFLVDSHDQPQPYPGTVYLAISNELFLRRLHQLYHSFKANRGDRPARGTRGQAPLWHLFRQLRDIRFWGPQDRLRETQLLEDWEVRLQQGDLMVPVEVELWYRPGRRDQQARQSDLERFIQLSDGHVLDVRLIREIAYHGAVVEVPRDAVPSFRGDNPAAPITRWRDVKYLRPVGQAAVPATDGELLDCPVGIAPIAVRQREPIVALLDGLPLQRHAWLDNRLMIDDPDGWETTYPAAARQHGTAMASLILHGDRTEGSRPLDRPLYVRPIMQPGTTREGTGEKIPDHILPPDLMRRVFRRMFVGDDASQASAASVRIVNLSIGDPTRVFDRAISPWGRFLDWLTWEHKALVLTSAGNHWADIHLKDIPREPIEPLDPEAIQAAVLRAMAGETWHRRLHSPAEAVNVLTVGAIHEDALGPVDLPRIDVFPSPRLPSPYNRLGHGFRRSVKPEILMPGGRQAFSFRRANRRPYAVLTARPSPEHGPGQLVAQPSGAGDLRRCGYAWGTSNATALASRAAAQLHDVLAELAHEWDGDLPVNEYTAVLLKAMLVHGATWGGARAVLQEALLGETDDATAFQPRSTFREFAPRLLGYGAADPSRLLSCTDQRATLVGYGSFDAKGAQLFRLPLPPSLSGKLGWRRLTITLAWLTPINPNHQEYRRAVLSFAPMTGPLRLDRPEVTAQAARRGTVQHEILQGTRADVFLDGDEIGIRVECRETAGGLMGESVPYALVVSLEVAEELTIPLYEEVRERIRPRVRVVPALEA